MTRIARTAPFASYLGLGRPTKSKPQAQGVPKPAQRPKTQGKPKATAASDKPAFAHLLAEQATTLPLTPAQRAEMRGAAARAAVAAYAKAVGQVPAARQEPKPGSAAALAVDAYRRALPGGPQTSPVPRSESEERQLAARIIAAGKRRRGES